jgi:proteasome-associated ATPase
VKVKVGRPDATAARDIFSKYVSTDLPFAEDDLKRHGGDARALVDSLMNMTVDAMYATTDENKFIEVTYANGEKEVLYFKDFASGALIEGHRVARQEIRREAGDCARRNRSAGRGSDPGDP